jgi:type II secretory ATPase GspE/PulE/Tfp pilus assembly ATPase PilB-like protein
MKEKEKNGPVDRALFELIPAEVIRELRAFICERGESEITVAAVSPENSLCAEYLKKNFTEKVTWLHLPQKEFSAIMNDSVVDFKKEISRLLITETETNGNVALLVEYIIRYALLEKASDIHVEPGRTETSVRFRKDGMLHYVFTFPKKLHSAVIARFKILANAKIDEYRRPQDGRIEIADIPDVSFRVSFIPTLHGEKIALRILDDSGQALSLNDLGFSKTQEKILLENIEKPFGMIITSGPTGSGKTTTLYALLQTLKNDSINISTLEDPVEFSLAGVNQMQINPRLDISFAAGLRAFLRQDPDVIMVGEIRDTETMEMSANAAMTGHMVLTTIHTNDAPSAFVRFLEMGVDDFVLTSIVNLIIAQRLVRRICDKCAKNISLDKAIYEKIHTRRDITDALFESGIGVISELADRKFRKGTGCDACMHTGYKGRMGIYELLLPTKEVRELILKHASAEEIRKAAKKEGFEDMVTDGIKKALNGQTTIEEILRVTRAV